MAAELEIADGWVCWVYASLVCACCMLVGVRGDGSAGSKCDGHGHFVRYYGKYTTKPNPKNGLSQINFPYTSAFTKLNPSLCGILYILGVLL
jgi:hypothetical protein